MVRDLRRIQNIHGAPILFKEERKRDNKKVYLLYPKKRERENRNFFESFDNDAHDGTLEEWPGKYL